MLRCHIWVLLGVKRLFSLSLSFSLFLACSKPIFGPLQTGTSILVLVSATWRWRRFLKWVACTTLGVAVPFFVVSYLFRPPFLLFPFDVFWFRFDFIRCFFRIRLSFSFLLFLYFVFFTCLSVVSLSDTLRSFLFVSFLNGKSLNVPSLLLCFTVQLSIFPCVSCIRTYRIICTRNWVNPNIVYS